MAIRQNKFKVLEVLNKSPMEIKKNLNKKKKKKSNIRKTIYNLFSIFFLILDFAYKSPQARNSAR